MTDDEALIQAMFDACTSCCADVADDEACNRCRLMSRASKRIAALKELDARTRKAFAEMQDTANERTHDRDALLAAIGFVPPYHAEITPMAIGRVRELREQIATLRADLDIAESRKSEAFQRIVRERDDARTTVQWFVEHAADKKLDGYRELGARAAAAENECDRWRARFAAAVIDGDRMRATLHDLAFAAPVISADHADRKGWLSPEAWGAYVSRVQKMAGNAIRRPLTDHDAEARAAIVDRRAPTETALEREARDAAKVKP